MIADDHDLAENFSPWVGGPMAHRAGGRLPGRYAPGPTAAPDRLQRRSHAAAGGPGGGGRLRDGGPALRYGMHTSRQPIDFLGLPIFARDQDKAFTETVNH